jgi:hypothetical protein
VKTEENIEIIENKINIIKNWYKKLNTCDNNLRFWKMVQKLLTFLDIFYPVSYIDNLKYIK